MKIHVAAAAILDESGRVLISQRAKNTHQGGLWEFPGGKLEAGETAEAALSRELEEELGILPLATEPLIRIRHDYVDRHVVLDFYRVTAYRGEPKGLEGQPLQWLSPADMQPEDFPAADRPVISALKLPQQYMITGRDAEQPGQFLSRLSLAIERGIQLVQLRAHQLSDSAYRQLLADVLPLCRASGVNLLINRPQGVLAWHSEADGLHLTATQLVSLTQRPACAKLIGASCHQLEEVKLAERAGLDYVLLSPVQRTTTHPQAVSLGWPRFAELVDQVNLPVYALGGLSADDLPKAILSGAQGIAAISAFWPD
ncbi:MAG: Nudix family hydrolase [Candidatus Thiodiazotropha lotti]|nr:Nudix family hydrolase [Candidatus Thiodiazotropha lotti]MCG8002581.1 Nudix family hydrolase [Candidatus Thiodiazotropha lotti]MCG8008430.1 Nudix family hydrolase [Candidatus Thiodiazotropha lotti]MCW4186201.1 Nudix family hydrolase [Candidatus Thiodiazotropha lotti]MCW4196019.1 Nudix family hydrolase [Candidatus Thiodiazotropha lotti]